MRPFSSVATRCTFESVEGKMRPRMASTLLLTRIASVKSPVTCVRAARKRLPKLCPVRPRPAWKRYCIVALLKDEALLGRLFQYRFYAGRWLIGHNFCNLFLACLTRVPCDFTESIRVR